MHFTDFHVTLLLSSTALFWSLLLAASLAPAGLFSLFLGNAAGCAIMKEPQHKDAGDDAKPRNVPLPVGQQKRLPHVGK